MNLGLTIGVPGVETFDLQRVACKCHSKTIYIHLYLISYYIQIVIHTNPPLPLTLCI